MTQEVKSIAATMSPVKQFDLELFRFDSMRYRNENKLSRVELGVLLNESEHSINAYERKNVMPKLDLFFNLCTVMGKNIYEYFK